MTAQLSDFITFDREHFSLAGVEGECLFDPERYGMKPVLRGTACWRGFVCGYAVTDGRLTLEELRIGLDGPALPLAGRTPAVDTAGRKSRLFDAEYRDLSLAVPFTGRLLLGRDLLDKLRVRLGLYSVWKPAWEYRVVRELIFEAGDLVRDCDRSDETARIRDELAKRVGPASA